MQLLTRSHSDKDLRSPQEEKDRRTTTDDPTVGETSAPDARVWHRQWLPWRAFSVQKRVFQAHVAASSTDFGMILILGLELNP